MNEGQPIGLSAFAKDLVSVAQVRPAELDDVANQRVVFPNSAQRAEVEAKNLNFRREEAPDYYLRLSAYYALPQEELTAILQEALGRGKSLKLPSGHYDARLKQAWTPQDFNAEAGLPSFWHSKTSVTSYASTISPDNVRMLGANQSTHRAEVELERNIMTIEAEGEYRRHLRNIAGALEPQIATVRLSKEDAERVMELSQQNAVGRLLAGQLRKQLEPQERTSLRIGIGTGVSFDTQDVIELNLRTGQVLYLEGQLHKDLFRPAKDQESQVVKLSKVYSLVGILRNRRFGDMKRVAGMLEEIAFSPNGNYAVSEEQAKALLDKELQMLQDFYGDDIRYMFALGGNMHIFRGNVVKRLARELLGEEVVEPLQELGVDEYVNFLASKGYNPGQFETGRILPPYSVKERHLLEFYQQVYQQDPSKAAALYRRGYLNTRPSVTIDADIRDDGSKIQRLDVASKARIFSFEVKQPIRSSGNNDFSFGTITPNSEDAHFWARTRLSGSELLPLQEWACDKVGITFS